MDPIVSYKAFEIDKSYNDIIHDSTIWISDLKFIKKELLFLKTTLKSNSLKLLLKDSNRLNEKRKAIKEKIEKYRDKVAETLNSDVFSFSEGYFEAYQSLVKEIFEFNQKYKSFKTDLYDFLIEIT